VERRFFLKAAASLGPAAVLHHLVPALKRGQAPASSSPELHVVRSGEDRFGQSRSLGFSALAFKVGTAETGGGLFVIEHTHLRPGGGPPLHMHPHQEEWFYVMDGKVAFAVGEQKAELGPGECVLAPRAVPHTFCSLAESSRLLIGFSPAGKMEQYFLDAEQHRDLAPTKDFIERYDMKWIGPSPFWKS
jgi:mannose-6-phosphate isomerase-like protein (cupin superfamily)